MVAVLPVLSGRSSELYGASFLSAYHRLNGLMILVALIVSAIYSYSLPGKDCLTYWNCFELSTVARYFYCILICLYNASLIIIFYDCFSDIVSLISFSVECSALDYHGTSRRLFVGLDSGTISVSVFFLHLFILVLVKFLRNCSCYTMVCINVCILGYAHENYKLNSAPTVHHGLLHGNSGHFVKEEYFLVTWAIIKYLLK